MSQDEDFTVQDPYKMGEPPSSGDSPQSDDGQEPGLADEQDKEGLGELEQALQKHGFKNPEEMIESWKNTKSQFTQESQKRAELEKKYNELQSQLESKKTPEPEQSYTDEEISQMFLDNPTKATEWMREQVMKDSGLDELKNEIADLKAQNTWNSFRTSKEDFQSYEDRVKEKLNEVYNDPSGQKAVEFMYEFEKMKDNLNNLNDKKEQSKKAKETTQAQAKKAAAASESGSQPMQGADEEEMVDTPVGKMNKADLDLVGNSPFFLQNS